MIYYRPYMEPHAERIQQYAYLTQETQPEQLGSAEREATQKLETAYRATYPQKDFGEISATRVMGTFQSDFEESLKKGFEDNTAGSGDNFLTTAAQNGVDSIYVIKSSEKPNDSKIVGPWQSHQPDVLQDARKKLSELASSIDTNYAAVPTPFRKAYTTAIDNQLQFVSTAEKIGTTEFTQVHRTPQEWAELIDTEKTQAKGELTLRFEDEAKITLELNKQNKDSQNSITIDQAFAFWGYTDNERAEILGQSTPSEKLSAEQVKRLFEVNIKRLGQNGVLKVEIVSGTSSISYDTKAKTYKIPDNREFTGEDILYIPPHETVHGARGVNGFLQECPLLGTGMEGYLPTEEGLAGMAEMIMGQPFGHRRQVEFAARYLIAAMSLKTKEVDNKTVPMYSVQDIYNTLRGYNVPHKVAAMNIWRSVRGTSLTRQVVPVNVATPNGDKPIHVAETFVKDTAYFEGHMKMLKFFRASMPLMTQDVQNGNLAIENKPVVDFAPDVLRRVGQAIDAQQNNRLASQLDASQQEQLHQVYTQLGRHALLNMLQYFIDGGKMTLESALDPESPWNKYLKRSREDGIVKIQDLFKPAA